MYDELTQEDIDKLNEELNYRSNILRSDILNELAKAKEFGDTSDNAEYREAKRAKGRNESRIKYLKDMILTAVLITPQKAKNEVTLYSKITVVFEDDQTEMQAQITTTVGQDPTCAKYSKESPFGKAVLGKRVGDRVLIPTEAPYYVFIKDIQ